MALSLHKDARATPLIRVAERASRRNLSEATVRKGRRWRSAHDRWSARHPLLSSLNATQEALVVRLRHVVG